MNLALALLALAGCDRAFGIDTVRDAAADDGGAITEAIAPMPDACLSAGHDEDVDNTPDACDPCPAQPSNLDTDRDGVGDACDPFPTTPGDTRTLFDGFDQRDAAWLDPTGMWMFGNDHVNYLGTGAPSTLTRAIAATDATVDATFDYKLDLDKAAYAGIQMAIGGTAVMCIAIHGVPDDFVIIRDSGTQEGPEIDLGTAIGPLRLVLTHLADTSFRCSATIGTTTVTIAGDARSGPTTAIGLTASQATMSASSIAVFAR